MSTHRMKDKGDKYTPVLRVTRRKPRGLLATVKRIGLWVALFLALVIVLAVVFAPPEKDAQRPTGRQQSAITTLGNGESWTSPTGVTFTVSWKVDEWLLITVRVKNGSDAVVKNAMSYGVSVNGTPPFVGMHGATETEADGNVIISTPPTVAPTDVLPGREATTVDAYEPMSGDFQTQVSWGDELAYPHPSDYVYWTGKV